MTMMTAAVSLNNLTPSQQVTIKIIRDALDRESEVSDLSLAVEVPATHLNDIAELEEMGLLRKLAESNEKQTIEVSLLPTGINLALAISRQESGPAMPCGGDDYLD